LSIWSGADCLKEYALHLLKIEALYNLFFENKLSKSLIEVAPSLPELSILGKITSGIRKVGPLLNFDSIVVDSFSTGHMISLLKAPRGMLDAIPIGPMGEQTRGIIEVIKNKRNCKYWITCLPEELPVIESIDLAQQLYAETNIKPHLIMNKLLNKKEIKNLEGTSKAETQFIDTLNSKVNYEESLIQQLVQSEHFQKLSHSKSQSASEYLDCIEIPFYYENNSEVLLEQMRSHFTDYDLNNFQFPQTDKGHDI
jgi:anion-transporting  ArsA/GET3 family ATPase